MGLIKCIEQMSLSLLKNNGRKACMPYIFQYEADYDEPLGWQVMTDMRRVVEEDKMPVFLENFLDDEVETSGKYK